jgi:hypothetical protein
MTRDGRQQDCRDCGANFHAGATISCAGRSLDCRGNSGNCRRRRDNDTRRPSGGLSRLWSKLPCRRDNIMRRSSAGLSRAGGMWSCGCRRVGHRRCPGKKRARTQRWLDPGEYLATTYSHRTYRPTTIGAEAFHFRVRNGTGWFHLALVTRGQYWGWMAGAMQFQDWVSGGLSYRVC